VDSKDLTAAQLDAMIASLAPARDHCGRLRDRMGALSFPDADPLVRVNRRAHDALESLVSELRELYDRAARPEWAGGKVARIPKPRSRRARPG
jgi:hypothetical protein